MPPTANIPVPIVDLKWRLEERGQELEAARAANPGADGQPEQRSWSPDGATEVSARAASSGESPKQSHLLFLSLSRVVVGLGLQDSTWSLVLVYPTITIPVSVWLLMGFLRSVPRDIEEQAMVDGYSRLGAFVRAVVPLVIPGIVAVAVFAFTLTASEFIYALAFVSPPDQMTVSTGVPTQLIRGDVFFWQSLQAATVLVAVPIALVFNLFLDRFIAGAVKGVTYPQGGGRQVRHT